MSKAFDTVSRAELFKDLAEILENDELHLMKILLKDVILQVRCGKELGPEIRTNVGVPQGDGMSPILFTLYLAQALKPKREGIMEEHSYSLTPRKAEEMVPQHLIDHTYSRITTDFLDINQQYADDISYVTDAIFVHNNNKKNVPTTIKKRNLNDNSEKTEEYHVKRNGEEHWKKCKFVGSMLDTTNDINRRKGLAMCAYNKLKYIVESKKVSNNTKMKVINTYVKSIFLYNSELWTLTKELENTIDVFQRSLLRRTLGIYWHDKVTNTELYRRANTTEWSREIKHRRLKWFGHLLRLPNETPAKQALRAALTPVKRPRGKPKLTWLGLIQKDLAKINIRVSLENLEDLIKLANERSRWYGLTGLAMSNI